MLSLPGLLFAAITLPHISCPPPFAPQVDKAIQDLIQKDSKQPSCCIQEMAQKWLKSLWLLPSTAQECIGTRTVMK
eukprot:1153277-Pelagomonas_calceolata.AAC.14